MASTRQKRSLVGAVVGPLIWALHFLFVYVFLSVGCVTGMDAQLFAGFNGVSAALLLGTAPFVAALLFGGCRSYGRWRRAATSGESLGEIDSVFLEVLTTALYATSLLAVIWVTLPILILGAPCR